MERPIRKEKGVLSRFTQAEANANVAQLPGVLVASGAHMLRGPEPAARTARARRCNSSSPSLLSLWL